MLPGSLSWPPSPTSFILKDFTLLASLVLFLSSIHSVPASIDPHSTLHCITPSTPALTIIRPFSANLQRCFPYHRPLSDPHCHSLAPIPSLNKDSPPSSLLPLSSLPPDQITSALHHIIPASTINHHQSQSITTNHRQLSQCLNNTNPPPHPPARAPLRPAASITIHHHHHKVYPSHQIPLNLWHALLMYYKLTPSNRSWQLLVLVA